MRIYLSSGHQYPGRIHGVAAHAVHDWLAKGLGALGHEVFYHLPERPEEPLPEGVTWCNRIPKETDLVHINHGPEDYIPDSGHPWVRIVHHHLLVRGPRRRQYMPNWIYVSKAQAELYGSLRYVHNGIDPQEFIYSGSKDDYFLFMFGGLSRAQEKGLSIALAVAKKTGIELRIAAAGGSARARRAFAAMCRAQGVVPVGEVRGRQKAELFAGARALLVPTQIPESFGLVLVEALMSGTPVIGSDNGAIPELIDSRVGFVCRDEADYIKAILNIDRIDPAACRSLAVDRFHYLRMARDYVREYETEIRDFHENLGKGTRPLSSSAC